MANLDNAIRYGMGYQIFMKSGGSSQTNNYGVNLFDESKIPNSTPRLQSRAFTGAYSSRLNGSSNYSTPVDADSLTNRLDTLVVPEQSEPEAIQPADEIPTSEATADLLPEVAETAEEASSLSLPAIPVIFGMQAAGNLTSSNIASQRISQLQTATTNQALSGQLGARFLAASNEQRGMSDIMNDKSTMDSLSLFGPMNSLVGQTNTTLLTPNTTGYVFNDVGPSTNLP